MPQHTAFAPRRLAGVAVAVLAAVWVLLLGAFPASAHTELTSSQPGDGGRLKAPPTSVALEFNEPVNADFARLTLRTGEADPVPLRATVRGAKVTATVPSGVRSVERTVAQRWRVFYRVVSADGHPIEGAIAFTVAPTAAQPTPSESAAPEDGAATAGPGQAAGDTAGDEDRNEVSDAAGSGASWVPVVIVAALAVGSVAGVGVWLWRIRREDGTP